MGVSLDDTEGAMWAPEAILEKVPLHEMKQGGGRQLPVVRKEKAPRVTQGCLLFYR